MNHLGQGRKFPYLSNLPGKCYLCSQGEGNFPSYIRGRTSWLEIKNLDPRRRKKYFLFWLRTYPLQIFFAMNLLKNISHSVFYLMGKPPHWLVDISWRGRELPFIWLLFLEKNNLPRNLGEYCKTLYSDSIYVHFPSLAYLLGEYEIQRKKNPQVVFYFWGVFAVNVMDYYLRKDGFIWIKKFSAFYLRHRREWLFLRFSVKSSFFPGAAKKPMAKPRPLISAEAYLLRSLGKKENFY